MENINIMVFCYFSLLSSVYGSEFYLAVDDILNSDLSLFPNTTVFHQSDFKDQTLEHFKRLLNDDVLIKIAYSTFKKKFGEKGALPTRSPFSTRIHVFKDNLVQIFQHNLRAKMKLFSTYEMGVNQFADMEKLGLIIPEDSHQHNFPQPANQLSFQSRSLPVKFDWSYYGVIGPVRDQLGCATCVIFAITSALEGIYAIMKNWMVDLSEQHVLDCAIAENGYSRNKGCEGNAYTDTFQFAMDHGLVPEQYYPYSGQQSQCYPGLRPITRLKSYERVNSTPEDLKVAVLSTGPVSIGIFVTSGIMFYKGGVYDDCFPGHQIGGHTLAVIGYNDEGRVKYYRLKNQWGDTWGENGFMRYISTDPRCGMEQLAFSLRI